MNDDANDKPFPFYRDYPNTYTDDTDDTNVCVNHTWVTGNYTYHAFPTLESIDGKIENIKVLINNLEGRISVIEQNMLRLITKVEEILDKVKKDGKV